MDQEARLSSVNSTFVPIFSPKRSALLKHLLSFLQGDRKIVFELPWLQVSSSSPPPYWERDGRCKQEKVVWLCPASAFVSKLPFLDDAHDVASLTVLLFAFSHCWCFADVCSHSRKHLVSLSRIRFEYHGMEPHLSSRSKLRRHQSRSVVRDHCDSEPVLSPFCPFYKLQLTHIFLSFNQTICMRYFFAAGAVSLLAFPFFRRVALMCSSSLSLSFQSAGILPLVRAVGVGVANTIVAGLSFFGVLLLLLVIRYGEGWAGRAPPPPPSPKPPFLVETEVALSLQEKKRDGEMGGEENLLKAKERLAIPLENISSIESRPSV